MAGSERYLMGRDTFVELRKKGELPVSVETDFARYMIERSDLLQRRLDEVHRLIDTGELDNVEITRDGFSIKPHRGAPIPDAAMAFADRVNAALPRIKITDLLVEVDAWTGFTDQFTHLRTGLPADDKQALLSVILADGINLGLTRMAEAAPGSSFKRLSRIADWYVREECYSRALAEVVNQHHRAELSGYWGDGTTSSSDGQHFPLGSTGKELGHVNPKYGSQPVVIFYTHISDQYSPYHTKCIATNARDATFVLDGLLYHESDLVIEEHYTDTAGFTDHVFALCHLLGFRFAPRLRDIGERRLYPIGDQRRWPKLAPAFGEGIQIREIESPWDDVLRLASSIRLGTVTASLIVRKLAAYPRQNRLALAMRELGRIERTLFLLNWMQDPALRGRVQAGLNKGEAKHALSRAVFFNRLGELRDRSFESQSSRASGLNLVVAAIILWNTHYLEKAIEQVRQEIQVPDEYLQYLSPLGWDHINLTGDYIWNLR
jgi:TnpA family transposase